LRIEIEKLLGFSIKKHFLFEGLSEAITNVGQHAYPDSDNYPFKQWWLSASYDQSDRTLCIIFYDQGVGIPETLPRAGYMEWAKELIGTWADSKKIEAAMQPGRSATDQEERGKGLQNFIEFAKSHRQGFLSIYSLRGLYRMTWAQDAGESAPETLRRDHENSVGGTLIEWRVKL
jgi:hypothetical protein